MLQILDEKQKRSLLSIENEYPNCKLLLRDFTDDNEGTIEGYLYAISTSIDSYQEICDLRRELNKSNRNSIVFGSYNNGGS